MASNSKALIAVLFFLFLLSAQPIIPSTARKILERNEFGSNDKVYETEKLETGDYPNPPTEGIPGPSPSNGDLFVTGESETS